jgi:hypothetical protein
MVPNVQEPGWAHGKSGWVQKILPPLGLDPWTVQYVVSNYTNYTILILTNGEIPFEKTTCRPKKFKNLGESVLFFLYKKVPAMN